MKKTVFKINGQYVKGMEFKDGKIVPWLTDNPKEIPENQLSGPWMEAMIERCLEPGQTIEKEDIEL